MIRLSSHAMTVRRLGYALEEVSKFTNLFTKLGSAPEFVVMRGVLISVTDN